ncbi:nitroreductase family protein [Paenibacillus sp. MMS18-CY102]|uniref:nitroreductase family protein n=1 Tax=Paenibacillus sp. MMS18-CY102 TaxID=2682849 RepID=UPI001365CE51|nr:nitroreductase [Paenibacillus sp. MMS18-CY102]MWC31288.1 nitroreductase [Paenibacillus sp. MMS18-CY102]
MLLEEAIRNRRSIGKVKPDPVERALIEQLIEAATWAPNHHGTEPWKFIVMAGDGRQTLGEAYASIAAGSLQDMEGKALEDRLDKERAKALRAPVVIAVVCTPSDSPRVTAIEELAAAHTAVQNLLLTAHALGLGAVWRSGDPMYHPLMHDAFGLSESEKLVALVYIGYPDLVPPAGKRQAAASKTVWLEG